MQKPFIPDVRAKFLEGKMFERLECHRCHTLFNFSPAPRVTRIPHCPACGGIVNRHDAA